MHKIMFYINTIRTGGAERVMVNLSKQLVDKGYEVVFVTSYRADGEYELDFRIKRVVLEESQLNQSRITRNISRIQKLRHFCRVENPSVLVAFMAEPNFRAICATLGLKTKVIISVRNDPKREYAGKIGRLIGKLILPIADGCVFQTEEAKAWFPAKLQKKSTIIYNAVKRDFYRVYYKSTQKKIVTFGRLESQKNHKMLIDAFYDIVAEFPEAKLLIYGEGSLREEYAQYIIEKGLETNVQLMGTTTDVPNVLQDAACFVLSSDYEGMPNALMEAMAAGVPCISTDCPCGGPRMLINNGENGILVPVADSKKMADALRLLLTNRRYAEKLGQNARVSAEEFEPMKVFEQWKKYIESVCE